MIVNCKEIREREVKRIVENGEGKDVRVAFIQVGENSASDIYVRNKKMLCEQVGISVTHYHFKENHIDETKLVNLIHALNALDDIDGIMVQLPLPQGYDENKIINAIDPKKDIDGFHYINKGKLMVGDEDALVSCTPAAVMDILNHLNMGDLKGKNVVIAGRSNIVGKPLAQLMINKGATVTVCNSSTNKHFMGELISQCDIFVSAIGKANYFNSSFFNDVDIPISRLRNITAIDIGINRGEDNKIYGDISKELYDHFKYITPVPGGVGIMTVLHVLLNSIKCHNKRK